jgi:predicted acetyltransferase
MIFLMNIEREIKKLIQKYFLCGQKSDCLNSVTEHKKMVTKISIHCSETESLKIYRIMFLMTELYTPIFIISYAAYDLHLLKTAKIPKNKRNVFMLFSYILLAQLILPDNINRQNQNLVKTASFIFSSDWPVINRNIFILNKIIWFLS